MLNEEAIVECEVRFFEKLTRNRETGRLENICMVALPKYKDEQIKLTEEERKQGYLDERLQTYYFRVTEDQFYNLTKDCRKSLDLAKEKIKDVTFNYEELFGDF